VYNPPKELYYNQHLMQQSLRLSIGFLLEEVLVRYEPNLDVQVRISDTRHPRVQWGHPMRKWALLGGFATSNEGWMKALLGGTHQ